MIEAWSSLDEEFASVSASRREDVLCLADATREARTNWIVQAAPTADMILLRYPKFVTTPELVWYVDYVTAHTSLHCPI
jgi:hypothetical protein